MDTGIVTDLSREGTDRGVNEINREPGPAFVTFSKPYDVETAMSQFEARYGYPPEKVKEYKGYLMVGPVPEREFYRGVDNG